jgi:hypothetical protein
MAEPYRPSNGTAGADFEDRWCSHCSRDAAFRANPDSGDGCPIVAATFAFEIDHPEYPKEWVTNEKGPRCTAFTTDAACPVRCAQTADLFAVQ